MKAASTAARTDRDRKILACAWFWSQGVRQSEISRRLDIAQATVSRYISEAQKNGWLALQVIWPSELSVGERHQIVNMGYARRDELLARLRMRSHEVPGGVVLSSVHVINVPVANHADQLEAFARDAGPLLVGWLEHARICGAAWGRTLSAVARAMPPQTWTEPRLFIPVAGEPLNHPDHALSPTRVVRDLAAAAGAHAEQLSLQGVPARIPKALAGGDAEVIHRFVRRSVAYERIFLGYEDGPPPLMKQADTILVGIGSEPAPGQGPDPWYEEITEVEQDDKHNTREKVGGLLRSLAAGNVGGCYVPKAGGDRQERVRIDALNDRSLGLKMAHLDDCAARCQATEFSPEAPSGVICFAIEPEKAAVLWEALGHLNRVVVSDLLADRLLEAAEDDVRAPG